MDMSKTADDLLFQFTPLREGRPLSIVFIACSAYFNSRPCGRGDVCSATSCICCLLFQFTPLREGRPHGGPPFVWGRSLFQFTPLREGRQTAVRPRYRLETYFNSRPCGRGDAASSARAAADIFQFTPLREGRRRRVAGIFYRQQISIHAPAGGATAVVMSNYDVIRISIHAPAGGATKRLFVLPHSLNISIHAPAGGATLIRM